jgi:hypothetical protein
MDRKEKEFLDFLDSGIKLEMLKSEEAMLEKVEQYKRRKGGWRKSISKVAVVLILVLGIYLMMGQLNTNNTHQIASTKKALNSVDVELQKVLEEVETDYEIVALVDEVDSFEQFVVAN